MWAHKQQSKLVHGAVIIFIACKSQLLCHFMHIAVTALVFIKELTPVTIN